MESNEKKVRRQFTGVVTSIAMTNTVAVRVDRVVLHPMYKKRYTTSKKFLCDWRGNGIAIGDVVLCEETRPISKRKKWRIIKKVSA